MKCCGLTASTERREPARMTEWMRASRWRAQKRSEAGPSEPSAPATRQAMTEPSPTRRARADRISPSVPVPIEAASSPGVTGPRIPRWPRAAATRASSRDCSRAGMPAGSLWSGTKQAPSTRAEASSRPSTATQRLPAGSSTYMARPVSVREAMRPSQSEHGPASTSEQSRSWSSSALRSSGRACSTIPATTAASRLARSYGSRGRPRRVVTARVRRSSKGASSKKV